jgi:hypothetical protein
MKDRKLKVQEFVKPQRYGSPRKIFPTLRLRGEWMTRAGILPGMVVTVEVSPNQIIIKI